MLEPPSSIRQAILGGSRKQPRPTEPHRRRDQHGAAAVEAALVLTFVVFPVVFGILSYGYLLTFRQSLSLAAAEAARAAAIKTVSGPLAQRQADQTTAAQAAVGAAVGTFNSSMACGQAHLVCNVTFQSCPDVSPSGCVRVEVSYPYRDNPLLPPVPGLGFTLPETLSYSAVAGVN
jgi:Flp pilus assembly protein TadG